MKVPSPRQFDFIHAVVRNARMEGLKKEDFLECAGICWDAHEASEERLQREENERLQSRTSE